MTYQEELAAPECKHATMMAWTLERLETSWRGNPRRHQAGCDLYAFDHYLAGPDCLERARRLLIQRRDACSDPDETALLTSIIRALETNDSW
jgi:hypothetical protein